MNSRIGQKDVEFTVQSLLIMLIDILPDFIRFKPWLRSTQIESTLINKINRIFCTQISWKLFLYFYPSFNISFVDCIIFFISTFSSYLITYLSIFLTSFPSLFLSIFLSIFLTIFLPFLLTIFLSILLSIYLSVFISIYLSVYLSHYKSYIHLSLLSNYISVNLSD